MSESEVVEKVPQSFAEYEPLILSKENLRKVATLVFDVNPDDLTGQELSNRLLEDVPIVRQKYALPSKDMWLSAPGEYYSQLEVIAHNEGVSLRSREEFEKFFQKRLASAVYFEHPYPTIALEKLRDMDNVSDALSKAGTLEHELIHAIQFKKYPRMSAIRKEYEAYIANTNENGLKTNPWFFLERAAISLTVDQLESEWTKYQDEKQMSGYT